MSIPTRESVRGFAQAAFENLSRNNQRIRFRLCEIVEHCVRECADTEDTSILISSAYLQEVGVIHSSHEKAIYSLEMVNHAFSEVLGELDPTLLDCIAHHDSEKPSNTAEGLLMQICYNYVKTHYFDYMALKSKMSISSFDRIQMARIENYSRLTREHPRGNAISEKLQSIFLLHDSVGCDETNASWRRALEQLHHAFPMSATSGHRHVMAS